MLSFYVHKVRVCALTVAGVFLLAASQMNAANPAAGEAVTFTAAGTFATTPMNGADTLKLAGEPFTINLVANSSMTPAQHGRNWAVFTGLTMNGTVYSGLLGSEPIAIRSKTAALKQTVGASQDILEATFPVVVIGISLRVTAHLVLPGGTLAKALIHPFPSAPLDTTNTTVTYADPSASTELGIQDGTVVAAGPTGANREAVLLQPGAAEESEDFPGLHEMYLLAPRSSRTI